VRLRSEYQGFSRTGTLHVTPAAVKIYVAFDEISAGNNPTSVDS